MLTFLLLAPGLALLAALGRRNAAPVHRLEDLFHAAALSFGILVLVGMLLGTFGLYRFAATGAPVFEGVILALLATLGAFAWRRRGTQARRGTPTAGRAP